MRTEQTPSQRPILIERLFELAISKDFEMSEFAVGVASLGCGLLIMFPSYLGLSQLEAKFFWGLALAIFGALLCIEVIRDRAWRRWLSLALCAMWAVISVVLILARLNGAPPSFAIVFGPGTVFLALWAFLRQGAIRGLPWKQ